MKSLLSLFLLVFVVLTMNALGHDQTEREKQGLKGRVKSVENYEIVFFGPEDNRSHGTKNLHSLSGYSSKGELLELWLLTNDANG